MSILSLLPSIVSKWVLTVYNRLLEITEEEEFEDIEQMVV